MRAVSSSCLHRRATVCIGHWLLGLIVVADEGADLAFLIRQLGGFYLPNMETGSWKAGEIYPDINTMAACIATLGCVILDSDNFRDDDGNINPAEWMR